MTPSSRLPLALGLTQRIAVASAVASLHALVLAGSLLIGSETNAPPNVLGVDVVSRGEMELAAGSAPTPDRPVLTPPVPEPATEAAQPQRRAAVQDDRPKAPPAPASDDPEKSLPEKSLRQAQERPAPQPAQPAQAAVKRVGAEDGARTVSPSSRRRYAALVSAEINRRKYYPAAARGRGDGGGVEITFEIGSDGALLHHQVTRSSGERLLDEAALKMVGSAHFPPPPARNFVGKIEISFRLRPKR